LNRIILSSLIVSLGLLLGRLMGFVREIYVASTFGVSAEADVAILALTIPDVLVSLLVAGGLSAALIPEFKKLSKQESFALFLQASIGFGAIFLIITLVLSLNPSVLISLFAPGVSQQTERLAQNVLAGVIWLIPLTVLAGISTAYLQAQEKFLMPALGTLIFNACVVFGLILFVDGSKNLSVLVGFIIIGGVLRWLSQLWCLQGYISWKGSLSRYFLTKDLFQRYWQAMLALSLLSMFPVVARSLASFSGEGGIAMMNYAWRLVEFPLGLVITVFSITSFPKLSESYVLNNEVVFSETLYQGVLWSLILSMAIMGVVLPSAETLVKIIFGWSDNISGEKILVISELLQIGIMILPFQAVIAMSLAALNARKETKVSIIVSMLGFVVVLVGGQWAASTLGIVGVMVFVLAGYAFVGLTLLYILHKRKLLRLDLVIVWLPVQVLLTSYGIAYFIESIPLPIEVAVAYLIGAMVIGVGQVIFFPSCRQFFMGIGRQKE